MIWRNAESHSSSKAGAANSKLHKELWDNYIRRNPNTSKDDIIKQRDVIENKVWGNTSGDTPSQ